MIDKTIDMQQLQAIEQTEAQILLEAMKRQQAGLQAQADDILKQLTMTNGAVEILEELLRRSQANETKDKINGNS